MASRNRTVPSNEKELRRFVYNFSRLVQADPARYGLDSADAMRLMNEADLYLQASFTAIRPISRTSPAVRAKNVAKARAVPVFRSYAAIVKANPDVPVWDKVELGIVVEKQRRKSPTPPPFAAPTLGIRGGTVGVHEIIYRDSEHLSRRAKPKGVTHLVLLRHVGDRAIADPSRAQYVGAFTRFPIRLSYVPPQAGQVVTYFAAWLTSSGRQTAWSLPVSMMIGGQDALRNGTSDESSAPVRLAA